MFGLGSLLGSFGVLPDILIGKKPEDALKDNLKNAALLGAGAYMAPAMGASGLLGGASTGATNPALIESALGTAGYGASSTSPVGLLGSLEAYAKPIGQAANAASSVQSMFGGQQQPMAMPAQLGATGDPIGNLLNNQQQEEMLRKQLMEKLQRRMYGGTL